MCAALDPVGAPSPHWVCIRDGSVKSAHSVTTGSSGFPVHWFGRFAVVELPIGERLLSAPALVGELCAVLDAGAAGLIIYLPGLAAYDSASLDALMRAAMRARGWRSWLRLVIPDVGVRRVVRLVALNAVMPVHASVTAAVAAAAAAEAPAGLAFT